MSRQLTPEEQEIIKRTEREGAELAAREKENNGDGVLRRRLLGMAIFVVVFLLFAFVSFAVFSTFGGSRG